MLEGGLLNPTQVVYRLPVVPLPLKPGITTRHSQFSHTRVFSTLGVLIYWGEQGRHQRQHRAQPNKGRAESGIINMCGAYIRKINIGYCRSI